MNAGQLHRLARLLREVATAATADPGELPVSAGDLAIAEDIAHHESTSIGQIAQRTGLAQSLVSKTVAAMRDAGILVTAPDPSDGRRMLVSVDPATRADLFSSRAARPIDAAIRQARPGASDAEVRRIGELLDDLAARLLT
jgi:DNA-binding MarR family transcriptional regulator